MTDLSRHLSSNSLVYNRLFILGNGFDLALGLKSGYNDFMKYYFNQLILSSIQSNVPNKKNEIRHNFFEDDLFIVGITTPMDQPKSYLKMIINNTDDLSFKEFMLKISDAKSFKLAPKGEFIFRLLNQINKENWVDIELLYFDVVYQNRYNKSLVLQFNEQLKFLKKTLINYLKELIKKIYLSDDLKQSMNKIFNSELEYEKLKPKSEIIKSIVNKNYFLNFNYTQLLNNVLSDTDLNKIEINNIHGTINDSDLEKIIFGYGDEDSKKFKELLEFNEDELIENIKTYKYLSSINYDSLNHFINSNSLYQVIIIGHSCQLSDKVLLNEIFTNVNCFSIKIYHYQGSKGFIKKTMSISRITEDPKMVRNKVFRFDIQNTIPQND
jgi:hypothetical protein